MSKRYPGNFITGNPVALSQTSNNGVFDLKDVSTAVGNSTWQEPDGIYEIGNSLRFRAAATAYLSRVPPVSGNKRKWTYSVWLKRGMISPGSQYPTIISCTINSSYNDSVYFTTTGDYIDWNISNTGTILRTANLFRDPSAWYHFVLVWDTDNTIASNRAKIYVNGVECEYSYDTRSSYLNRDSAWNWGGFTNYIGGSSNSVLDYDGQQTEINFVDGHALDPSYFGYFDPNTNIWQPKKYTGAYGQNGFYLPFKENTLFGIGCDRKPDTALGVYSTGSLQNTTYKWGSTAFTLTGGYYAMLGGLGSGYGTHYDEHYVDGKDFTIEFWYKGQASDNNFGSQDGVLTGYNYLCSKGRTNTSSNGWGVHLYSNGGIAWETFGGTGGNSGSVGFTGGGAMPNVLDNAWHHIAISRASGFVRVFIDGTQRASGTLNLTCNNTYGMVINGMWNYGDGTTLTYKCGGVIDDFRMYTGVSKYNANFTAPQGPLPIGEADPYWGYVSAAVPFEGKNGDTQFPFWKQNYFTQNNFSVTAGPTYDLLVDSPTNVFTSTTDVGGTVVGNYATLNPLEGAFGNITISNAGLTLTSSSNSGYHNCGATISPEGNKGYFEVICTNSPNGHIGVSSAAPNYLNYAASPTADTIYLGTDGSVYNIYTSVIKSGSITAPSTNDVIMVAFDFTNPASKKLWFGRNGTWGLDASNNTGNPAAGTNATVTSTNLLSTSNYRWYFALNNGAAFAFNFGQRAFAHTPPSGFGSLNTTNIQARGTSAVGKAALQPNKWFDVALSAGNTTGRKVELNFQPDLVALKSRDGAANRRWAWFDSARGPNATLSSQLTDVEATTTDTLTAFTPDGFTIGADAGNYGANGFTERWWQGAWKQSPTSGLNIISYTGTGVNNRAITHNLGVTPGFIIVKSRDIAYNWDIYHKELGIATTLTFTSDAQRNYSAFGSTAPTSSNFYTQNDFTNTNNSKYIAWVWAEVPGFSRFGTYTGNGSTDGPFVYTGFRPRFVLWKNVSSSSREWILQDTARQTYNAAPNNAYNIAPNGNYVENDSGMLAGPANANNIDFLSNGFKIRYNNVNCNSSGDKYVYAVFAENPFALNNRAR